MLTCAGLDFTSFYLWEEDEYDERLKTLECCNSLIRLDVQGSGFGERVCRRWQKDAQYADSGDT